MSQYHKTSFYVQHAIRMYIDSNKAFACNLYEGGAYESMKLPCCAIKLESQSTYNSALGTYGNKTSLVAIELQTGGNSTTEEQHWDLWAEIEDLFNKKRTDLVAALNQYVPEINFQKVDIRELDNSAVENTRITSMNVEVITSITGG